MKATWGIAAALLLVAAAMDASAKGWGGKKGFHGKCSGHKGGLIEQLDLSDDQQAQFETLKEDLRAQQQALGEQFRTDFEAILTDEQLATLEDRRKPARPERRPASPDRCAQRPRPDQRRVPLQL